MGSSLSRFGARKRSVERRRAVVFKVWAVDACRLARFEAMARLARKFPMDVWILSDDAMQPEVASEFAAIASSNPGAFFARTTSVHTRYPKSGWIQEDIDAKMSKWPFALWLNESKYEFAWYVEDDVVFTGEWHTFFGPAEDKAENADLVVEWDQQDRTWHHAAACRVRGKQCLQDNKITQSRLAIFRMSRRFASEWLNMRAQHQLNGHDEATVAVVCDQWPTCRRSRMHFPGGIYHLGHHGIFQKEKSNPVFKLRVLASYSHATGQVNFSQFPTDADVPRDRLFHPVKCEAEAVDVRNVLGASNGNPRAGGEPSDPHIRFQSSWQGPSSRSATARILVREPGTSASTASREDHAKTTRSQSPPNHLAKWPPKDLAQASEVGTTGPTGKGEIKESTLRSRRRRNRRRKV